MEKTSISVFWFRRDLRLEDNHGLYMALQSHYPVLSLFIFDSEILDSLVKDDARVSFVYDTLCGLDVQLKTFSSSLCCRVGQPIEVWRSLLSEYDVKAVFANEDYEPYAISRDRSIEELLQVHGISFSLFKDQVIFAKDEVVKADNTPYTVFTPFKNRWMSLFVDTPVVSFDSQSFAHFLHYDAELPSLQAVGFESSSIRVPDFDLNHLDDYDKQRNFPALDATSHLSVHLRFGTVSIRKIVRQVYVNQSFLNELVWREFFMQILYHFPQVEQSNFKPKYDAVKWRNNENDFQCWKEGKTGYPMVDAGMRELNATGYMHNRVRMVTAGFLCKHLLIDWRWGEAYFAEKLLDYELAANNGNWQWAAGTGCDAAPYFRVFNPTEQVKKFDKDFVYIRKWVPEVDSFAYPLPMVDHKVARIRAIETYKLALNA